MTHALEIAQLEKAYGAQRVLKGVNLDVKPGTIMGLLGPNGAGKSTLIRSVMGIVEPDAGSIRIGGQPWSREAVRGVGYLPEERGLYKDMKVGEQAVYFARLKGMDKADAVRALKGWFERLEVAGWWDRKVSDISKGMAQKIQFICTVVHEPALLILDEPLSGFDPINARRIIDAVRGRRSCCRPTTCRVWSASVMRWSCCMEGKWSCPDRQTSSAKKDGPASKKSSSVAMTSRSPTHWAPGPTWTTSSPMSRTA